MKVFIPEKVNVVELESAPFKNAREALKWARTHGIIGVMSEVDTAGKGEISISVSSIKAYVDANEKNKAYSYEISNIEILKGNAGDVPLPSDRTSMPTSILLHGVTDVNGRTLLYRNVAPLTPLPISGGHCDGGDVRRRRGRSVAVCRWRDSVSFAIISSSDL